MLKVIIDNGKFVHGCCTMTAAKIIVDTARRLGREAVIEGYLY